MQRPQDFAKIITYPLCVLGAFIKNKLITYAWICFIFLYIVLVGDVASLEVNTILFNYDTLYYIFQSGAYSLQYCFFFLFQNHSTRHGEIFLQVFDQGSLRNLHNNIGYCYYPWLPTNTPIAEDTAHFRHRIWRNKSETDLKVSILRINSHSIRRFYATKKEEKLVVLEFSNVYKPDQ